MSNQVRHDKLDYQLQMGIAPMTRPTDNHRPPRENIRMGGLWLSAVSQCTLNPNPSSVNLSVVGFAIESIPIREWPIAHLTVGRGLKLPPLFRMGDGSRAPALQVIWRAICPLPHSPRILSYSSSAIHRKTAHAIGKRCRYAIGNLRKISIDLHTTAHSEPT